MDLSKLPKMSQSPPPPPPPETPAQPAMGRDYYSREIPASGVGAEVWISAILGVICILIGRNFPTYLFTTMVGHEYHTGVNWVAGVNEGKEVAYPQLEGNPMLNDAAISSFGVALILEAALLSIVFTAFRFKRLVVMIALAVTAIATGFNLFVAVKLLGGGITPIFSLLAVAFGGYMATYEWRILRMIDTIGARQLP
jgi:hypothetical protein